VGTHEGITAVILARAREVLEPSGSRRAPALKETTLFLAGHGTGRDPNSRQAIERQAELVRALGVFAAVQAVFLEEEPGIGRCWELAATLRIVVVPFFVSDGLHVQEDIPVILGAGAETVRRRLARGRPAWRNPTERRGKLLWLSPSVGTHPSLAEVVMERVREAAEAHSARRRAGLACL
jgi:sirohydrochlorin cobaltochelatase